MGIASGIFTGVAVALLVLSLTYSGMMTLYVWRVLRRGKRTRSRTRQMWLQVGTAVTGVLIVGQVGVVVSAPFVETTPSELFISLALSIAIAVELVLVLKRELLFRLVAAIVTNILGAGLFVTVNHYHTFVMVVAIGYTILSIVLWIAHIKRVMDEAGPRKAAA